METPHPFIDVAGATLPLITRRHRSSRHIVVRYHPATDSVSLTLPKRAPMAQALIFLEERKGWLAKQRTPFAQPMMISHGAELPVLGQNLRLQRTGEMRGIIECKENLLCIPGMEEHFNRRVHEHFMQLLRRHCREKALHKAASIEARLGQVSVRDTHSRWGSCTSDGDLSFAWRLVFAPLEVLDYVIAHEVAHLRHMDHSPAFWRVVEQLCPHWGDARLWLRKEGQVLYRYRF